MRRLLVPPVDPGGCHDRQPLSPGFAKELHVEANLTDRLHLVVDLWLYDTVPLRRKDVFLERRLQDPIEKLATHHADATPDPPLRGVTRPQGRRNRFLRELRSPLVADSVHGDGSQARDRAAALAAWRCRIGASAR